MGTNIGLGKKDMEKRALGRWEGGGGGGWRAKERDRSCPHTFDSKKATISWSEQNNIVVSLSADKYVLSRRHNFLQSWQIFKNQRRVKFVIHYILPSMPSLSLNFKKISSIWESFENVRIFYFLRKIPCWSKSMICFREYWIIYRGPYAS